MIVSIMSDTIVEKKKKKSNRCQICRKKVGLMGFTCVCSDTALFCTEHRLPENHTCQYDHSSQGKFLLANKLVKVEGEKIIKI